MQLALSSPRLGWFGIIWDGFDRTMVVYWSCVSGQRHSDVFLCPITPRTPDLLQSTFKKGAELFVVHFPTKGRLTLLIPIVSGSIHIGMNSTTPSPSECNPK